MGKLITTSLGHYYEVKASIISQDKVGVSRESEQLSSPMPPPSAMLKKPHLRSSAKILPSRRSLPSHPPLTTRSTQDSSANASSSVKVRQTVCSDDKEKAQNIFYLVDAQDINEAKCIVNSFFNGTMIDYDIIAIVETPITTFVFDHKVMPL